MVTLSRREKMVIESFSVLDQRPPNYEGRYLLYRNYVEARFGNVLSNDLKYLVAAVGADMFFLLFDPDMKLAERSVNEAQMVLLNEFRRVVADANFDRIRSLAKFDVAASDYYTKFFIDQLVEVVKNVAGEDELRNMSFGDFIELLAQRSAQMRSAVQRMAQQQQQVARDEATQQSNQQREQVGSEQGASREQASAGKAVEQPQQQSEKREGGKRWFVGLRRRKGSEEQAKKEGAERVENQARAQAQAVEKGLGMNMYGSAGQQIGARPGSSGVAGSDDLDEAMNTLRSKFFRVKEHAGYASTDASNVSTGRNEWSSAGSWRGADSSATEHGIGLWPSTDEWSEQWLGRNSFGLSSERGVDVLGRGREEDRGEAAWGGSEGSGRGGVSGFAEEHANEYDEYRDKFVASRQRERSEKVEKGRSGASRGRFESEEAPNIGDEVRKALERDRAELDKIMHVVNNFARGIQTASMVMNRYAKHAERVAKTVKKLRELYASYGSRSRGTEPGEIIYAKAIRLVELGLDHVFWLGEKMVSAMTRKKRIRDIFADEYYGYKFGSVDEWSRNPGFDVAVADSLMFDVKIATNSFNVVDRVRKKGRNVLFVLDFSGSMDQEVAGYPKHVWVKSIVYSVFRSLVRKGSSDGSVRVITFDAAVKTDMEIRNADDLLDVVLLMPDGGTEFEATLMYASKYFTDNMSVIFISDGIAPLRLQVADGLLKKLKSVGAVFNAVIVDLPGSHNNEAIRSLRFMAEETGGMFLLINELSEKVAGRIVKISIE